jgi:CRP-like cAMP-binding protein
VFDRGGTSSEAYIVLRGQVDIFLDKNTPPVASMGNGKIFGEQSFLDGAPRAASAVAAQPSILLVVNRDDFINLTRHEPALGMTVMRNIALDLSAKLRNADQALSELRRTGL